MTSGLVTQSRSLLPFKSHFQSLKRSPNQMQAAPIHREAGLLSETIYMNGKPRGNIQRWAMNLDFHDFENPISFKSEKHVKR